MRGGPFGDKKNWKRSRTVPKKLKGGRDPLGTSGCVCREYNAVVQAAIMTDLPRLRVEKIEFPLAYVGVDYFGPIEVKNMREIIKRWMCVFPH